MGLKRNLIIAGTVLTIALGAEGESVSIAQDTPDIIDPSPVFDPETLPEEVPALFNNAFLFGMGQSESVLIPLKNDTTQTADIMQDIYPALYQNFNYEILLEKYNLTRTELLYILNGYYAGHLGIDSELVHRELTHIANITVFHETQEEYLAACGEHASACADNGVSHYRPATDLSAHFHELTHAGLEFHRGMLALDGTARVETIVQEDGTRVTFNINTNTRFSNLVAFNPDLEGGYSEDDFALIELRTENEAMADLFDLMVVGNLSDDYLENGRYTAGYLNDNPLLVQTLDFVREINKPENRSARRSLTYAYMNGDQTTFFRIVGSIVNASTPDYLAQLQNLPFEEMANNELLQELAGNHPIYNVVTDPTLQTGILFSAVNVAASRLEFALDSSPAKNRFTAFRLNFSAGLDLPVEVSEREEYIVPVYWQPANEYYRVSEQRVDFNEISEEEFNETVQEAVISGNYEALIGQETEAVSLVLRATLPDMYDTLFSDSDSFIQAYADRLFFSDGSEVQTSFLGENLTVEEPVIIDITQPDWLRTAIKAFYESPFARPHSIENSITFRNASDITNNNFGGVLTGDLGNTRCMTYITFNEEGEAELAQFDTTYIDVFHSNLYADATLYNFTSGSYTGFLNAPEFEYVNRENYQKLLEAASLVNVNWTDNEAADKQLAGRINAVILLSAETANIGDLMHNYGEFNSRIDFVGENGTGEPGDFGITFYQRDEDLSMYSGGFTGRIQGFAIYRSFSNAYRHYWNEMEESDPELFATAAPENTHRMCEFSPVGPILTVDEYRAIMNLPYEEAQAEIFSRFSLAAFGVSG